MKQQDNEYLRLAIEKSKQSLAEGNFPAGAVVVKNNEVISSAVSSPYPGLFHADSKAVTDAFNKLGPLSDATLYIGLESCLMCTGVSFWGGIRRIVYAIPKSAVSSDYYETPEKTLDLVKGFNENIEMIHISELEEDASKVVRQWEEKMSINTKPEVG